MLTDAAALACNVGSSVLLIYSNKYLMSSTLGLGFTFGESKISPMALLLLCKSNLHGHLSALYKMKAILSALLQAVHGRCMSIASVIISHGHM